MKKIKFIDSDNEDARWIRKAKKGNLKAFEKLVTKYQKALYLLVRKSILNHDDTNDIVQDAFVKAFENIQRFEEDFRFYPWLHRIAINTMLNFVEKQKRRKQTFLAAEKPDEYSTIENSPSTDLIRKEYESVILRSIEKLPVEQRIVFVLKTHEDLSYKEIADHLNISVGTVMSRLSRAREKLKNMLRDVYINNDVKD